MTRSATPKITVHADYDSDPNDSDCYDATQLDAFKRGEWSYVGIVVSCDIFDNGAAIAVEGGSLWGIDYGCPATDADGVEFPYDHDAFLRESAADLWSDIPEDIRNVCGPLDWTRAPIVWTA